MIPGGAVGLPERFTSKFSVDENGCWVWNGKRNSSGYGVYWLLPERREARAHRVAYLTLRGEVPDGLELDHLCRVRHCCNPDHLEPVTHSENLRRSPIAGRYAWKLTECSNGHPYTPENVRRRTDGTRKCRTCDRAAQDRYRQKRKPDMQHSSRRFIADHGTCKRGHPWTPENTSVRSGGRGRFCRLCRALMVAARYKETKR